MSQPAIKERAKSDLSPANYMCVCRPTPVPAFRMARLAARSPQNILVTGGCGFIASHVVIPLVKKKRVPQFRGHGKEAPLPARFELAQAAQEARARILARQLRPLHEEVVRPSKQNAPCGCGKVCETCERGAGARVHR